MSRLPVVCLMGPTASGKTDLALAIADARPVEIVSVDSALVYRGMDIGTAKPDPATLAIYPHRLVDICEPEDAYSAGRFVRDALDAIREIHAAGRLPLLVGGTMLYFRALTRGMAELPDADDAIRDEIDARAAEAGWPALHAELARVDPAAAARIEPADGQRIQRALEVYRASGRPLSELQRETAPAADLEFTRIGLLPGERRLLHERIAARLEDMLQNGFVDEVRGLMRRPALTADAPSMRAVGYRQLWQHLAGETDFDTAARRALYATRQLATRPITWLRGERELFVVDPLEAGALDAILSALDGNSGR